MKKRTAGIVILIGFVFGLITWITLFLFGIYSFYLMFTGEIELIRILISIFGWVIGIILISCIIFESFTNGLKKLGYKHDET